MSIALRRRRAKPPRRIVLVANDNAGGDGSLNWAINALRDRLDDLTFALIPMGSGNDLARTLALPSDPVAAAQAVVAAAEREIDYGVASGAGIERLFVNACVGGSPVADDEALAEQTKTLLGSFAFWVAGANALPRLEQATVTVNGRSVRDCVVVGVGNGRTVGGGFPLFPNAAPDDRRLDACALGADDLPSMVRLLRQRPGGSHTVLDGGIAERSRQVTIDAHPALELNVDGELVGLKTPAAFKAAGRLRIRAPQRGG